MVTKQIFGDEQGFIFLTGRLVNEQKCLCRARMRRRGGGRDTILSLPKTQVFSKQRHYSIVAQVFSKDTIPLLPKGSLEIIFYYCPKYKCSLDKDTIPLLPKCSLEIIFYYYPKHNCSLDILYFCGPKHKCSLKVVYCCPNTSVL